METLPNGDEGESEGVSCLVTSNSLTLHGLWPTRILCSWISPFKNTGVGSIPFSRGSSRPRDQIQVSCIAGRFFTIWATREPNKCPDKKRYQRADSLSEGKPCEHTGKRWLCTSQEEMSYQEPTLCALWSQISSLLNCEKINSCCLSYQVYHILLWKTIQTVQIQYVCP